MEICVMKNALIVFSREPSLGKVKTRLSEVLGQKKTLEIYKCFVQDVLNVVMEVEDVDKYIFYTHDEVNVPFLMSFQDKFFLVQQEGEDLGIRMQNAFKRMYERSYEKVIVIGTDCLTITQEDLKEAFVRLNDCDCVLGPSEDGGYYLIGLNEPMDFIFKAIRWGTESVFFDTRKIIEKKKKSVSILDRKIDIDRIDDLEKIKSLVLFRNNARNTFKFLDVKN